MVVAQLSFRGLGLACRGYRVWGLATLIDIQDYMYLSLSLSLGFYKDILYMGIDRGTQRDIICSKFEKQMGKKQTMTWTHSSCSVCGAPGRRIQAR